MIKEKYNFVDKYLHYFILNNQFVSDFIFDIEKKLFLKNNDFKNHKHIFISGLARSGSTLLLNILHQNNNFCSFTYNDMPMILAPNLWSKFFKNKTKINTLEKRAHNDLININVNSPEAFDEVFWKYILKNNYITNEFILNRSILEKHLLEYSKLITLVCSRYGKKNYLSKNNNSIFRVEKILDYFKKSFFLIPFRDPISHTNSLIKQHNKFIDLQKNDHFVLKYMNWLGHHEFGIDQKPFKFKNENYISNKKLIKYWISIWIDYYEYILEISKNSENKNRIIFVNYNKLCTNKNDYLNKIFSKIGVNDHTNKVKIISNHKTNNYNIDKNQIEKANEIFFKLDNYINISN